MARIRSSRYWIGWTIASAAVFVLALTALTIDWEDPPFLASEPTITVTAGPTSDPSPTPSVDSHLLPLSDDPVTVDLLELVDGNWMLVEYDNSWSDPASTPDPASSVAPTPTVTADASDDVAWDVPGTRRLYVLDARGTPYRAADYPDGEELSLRLWLPDRRTAIVARSVDDDAVTLHSFDIITGELSDAFDGPAMAADIDNPADPTPEPPPTSTVADDPHAWIAADVTLNTPGDGLLVAHGSEYRSLVTMSLDGDAQQRVIPAGRDAEFVANPTNDIFISNEIVTYTGETWVEDILEWVPFSEDRQAIVSYSVEPRVTIDDVEYTRFDHGMPPAETKCRPVLWEPDRQLFLACAAEDGTAIYTLSLNSTTFVKAATVPAFESSVERISFNPSTTRILAGDAVYDLFGVEAWTLDGADPAATMWLEDYLVLIGEDDSDRGPGYGHARLRYVDAWSGDERWDVTAVEGAAGFFSAVPAS